MWVKWLLLPQLETKQEVINDVWRVVNAAYVDPTFNGQDWKSIRMKVGVFYDGMRQIDGSASEARRMMPGNKLWREHILVSTFCGIVCSSSRALSRSKLDRNVALRGRVVQRLWRPLFLAEDRDSFSQQPR